MGGKPMKRLNVLVLVLLFSNDIQAQQGCNCAPKTMSGTYTLESDEARVPFELIRNHILLSVKVNDRRTVKMILDTGMPYEGAVLFDCAPIKELGLEFTGKAMVQGPCGEGCGDSPAADVAMNVKLGLPGVTLVGQMLTVLDVGKTLGEDLHAQGILGYSVFGHFVVHIDFEKKIITLTEPEGFRYQGSGKKLPFTKAFAGMPEVECEVELANGKRVPVRLIVDTGAGHAVSLHVGSHEDLTLPEDAKECVIGRSMWGEVHGHIGRIGCLRLGGYELKNVPATFTSGPKTGPAQCGREGNLGNGALQRFHVTFHYAGKCLYLAPNKDFNEPMKYREMINEKS
jgi:hypothetical protein